MKILLFGSNGQVGSAIQKLIPKNFDFLALCKNEKKFCGNLENFGGIAETISIFKPNIIINAAAFTNVDLCETEKKKAYNINSLAVKYLAEEAKKINSFLIHYSTDYIFNDQNNLPISEKQIPSPLNYYGKTKLAGEQNIIAADCDYAIIRTSWVYSVEGNNFLKTILNLQSSKKEINVVNDQFGSPTFSEDIANFTITIIKNLISNIDDIKYKKNIYHFTTDGTTNWYEYAKFIISCADKYEFKKKIKRANILPVTSDQYKTMALRPKNSKLDNSLVKKTFNLNMKHWKHSVEKVVKELKDQL